MWLFDINYSIYNNEMHRKIFIVKAEHYRTDQIWGDTFADKNVYVVVEEWHTPESQGNTRDWNFYTFFTYQDASIFIAELAWKLNSPAQNGLLQAAEEFATYITENYERLAKQAKSIPEPKPIKQRTPDEQGRKREDSLQKANMKRVYIFDMGNGTVKIGVSNNIGARRQTIMFSSGLPINKYCYSDFLPTSTAVAIEQTCHKYFADQNTLGEFFAVSYQEAKAYLATHVRLVDNTTNLLS